MKCPTCEKIDLLMTDRQGITIDYCAVCRGVWLDRGELDKLIERATLPVNGSVAPDVEVSFVQDRAATASRMAARSTQPKSGDRTHREWDDDDDDDYRDQRRYKKRESFWSQLFDFD